MKHVDDETLALLALGEETDEPEVIDTLRACPHCRAELAGLRGLVTAGRQGGPLQSPSAVVWERVAAEIEVPAIEPGSDTVGAHRRRSDKPTRSRPYRAWVAAVAGVVIGVAGTLLGQNLADRPGGEVVASADLEPLPGWSESGVASLEQIDGERVLRVEVTGEPVDGYREVWLLDESAEQLVSVGLLTGTEETFALPADLDISTFIVVDISREPYDGDPAHSGDSIVRGRLA